MKAVKRREDIFNFHVNIWAVSFSCFPNGLLLLFALTFEGIPEEVHHLKV